MPGFRHAWSRKGATYALTEQIKNDLYEEVNAQIVAGLANAMESPRFREILGAETTAYIQENRDEFLADLSDGRADEWTEEFLLALNELLSTQEEP